MDQDPGFMGKEKKIMSDKQRTRNGLSKKELLKIIEDMDTRRRKEPRRKEKLRQRGRKRLD